MIGVEELVVKYPRAARAAVDGVSFVAARGQLTAIVGPNGSGKSSIVRALLGRVPIASGRITIDQVDVATVDVRDRARRVSVVPQREETAFTAAVRDYIALGRFPHLGDWRGMCDEDAHAVDVAATRAGVNELMDRRVDELSGGEWQRVRLARALAQGGEGIVLDEPTTFLDIAHEMAVFELLHSLAHDGRAVLLVSHQLNLVARFADRIVLLDRGRVAATGTPDEVMVAATLERVYEWPLVVTRDPAVGAPALLPLRGRRS